MMIWPWRKEGKLKAKMGRMRGMKKCQLIPLWYIQWPWPTIYDSVKEEETNYYEPAYRSIWREMTWERRGEYEKERRGIMTLKILLCVVRRNILIEILKICLYLSEEEGNYEEKRRNEKVYYMIWRRSLWRIQCIDIWPIMWRREYSWYMKWWYENSIYEGKQSQCANEKRNIY